MGLTAKEFSKLSKEEQKKRYMELDKREASRYRIHYAVIEGRCIEPQKGPTEEEKILFRKKQEEGKKFLYQMQKQGGAIPETMSYGEWEAGVVEG